jgi:hypothetical protein
MSGTCVRCGRIGNVHVHHPTLRGDDGRYFHSGLTADLCPPCHRGAHAVLQRAGLEHVSHITPRVVLARIAAFLAWIAWPWPGRPNVMSVPVRLTVELADVLEQLVGELIEVSV